MHAVQRVARSVTGYHQPVALDVALDLIARPRTRIVAGGTDLLLELSRGAPQDVDDLVDITRIPGLAGIHVDGEELVIGALVTHNQVVSSPVVVADALPLAQACLEVGGPPLRNRATIVGNIVTASPANDTISALTALGATLELRSAGGSRRLGIGELITGFRTTALADGELITAIRVPRLGPGRRGLFAKLGNRRAQAISVVHLAIVLELDGEAVTSAVIAAGSVAATVVRLTSVESVVVGTALDEATITDAAAAARAAISPIDDVRATAEYRSGTTAVILARSLRALRDGREREQWPARIPTLAGAGEVGGGLGPEGCAHGPDDPVVATVNGRVVAAAAATGRTLLDWLREVVPEPGERPLTGTKEGCAEGECGACTVMLDGDAVLACLVPAPRCHGATVTTVEGLAGPDRLHPVQQAYLDRAAVQCGYCIPGFLVAAAALLAACPAAGAEEVRRGLAGNLCRCTGYDAMFLALQDAAAEAG